MLIFLDFALFLVFWGGVSGFLGVFGVLGGGLGFLGVPGCSGMFRDVPGCSGVPGSTTCQEILSCFCKKSNNFLQVGLKVTKSQIIHTAFNSF